MPRILLAIIMILSLSAHAHAYSENLDPPLTGDMVRLTVYDKPKKLPEIMFTSTDGLSYLSAHRGHIVVLNLWATWCPPCIKELPSLNALQYSMDSHKLQVVNVSLDTTGPESVKKYLEDNNLMMLKPYVDASQQVQQLEILHNLPGIPITIIIDPQMRALAMYQGDADWNGRAARAVLDYYINNVSYVKFDVRM